MEGTKIRKKICRYIGLTLLVLILLFFTAALLLPNVLSTEFLIRFANRQIPGKIDAKVIELNWFGQQKIKGLKLYDPEGHEILACEEASVDSLTHLLFNQSTALLQLEVKGLRGKILRNPGHVSNIHQALGIGVEEGTFPPVAIRLFDVNARLEMDSKKSPRHIEISGKFESNETQGEMQVQAEFTPLLNVRAHVRRFPVALVSEMAFLERNLSTSINAALGSVLDADISVHQGGNVGIFNVSLLGAAGQLQIEGQIKEGVLTLQKPLLLECTASPELSENLLKPFIPILSEMTHADNRLQILISPEGFSCPLDQKNLNGIQLGKMSIHLGKVYFYPKGKVGKIFSNFQIYANDEISVWFTPIYLGMQSGKIQIQRFDIFAMEQFPLAIWGEIDLPGNFIQMMIGLKGRTLQSVTGFSVQDKDYIMPIPYKGKIGKASVDKTKVAARIAALAATLSGTPQGLALGAVIGFASGSFQEEKIPAPTTQPFPWQEEISSEETSQPTKNPLKQMKRGAESLLESLLR